jgi:hypothetical protein
LSAAAKIRTLSAWLSTTPFFGCGENSHFISMCYLQRHFSAAAKNRITQLFLAHFPNATWVGGPGPKETPL